MFTPPHITQNSLRSGEGFPHQNRGSSALWLAVHASSSAFSGWDGQVNTPVCTGIFPRSVLSLLAWALAWFSSHSWWVSYMDRQIDSFSLDDFSFQSYLVDTYLWADIVYLSFCLPSDCVLQNVQRLSLRRKYHHPLCSSSSLPSFHCPDVHKGACSHPLYHRTSLTFYLQLGVNWASTLLGVVGVILASSPFLFYKYGSRIRASSKFAPCVVSISILWSVRQWLTDCFIGSSDSERGWSRGAERGGLISATENSCSIGLVNSEIVRLNCIYYIRSSCSLHCIVLTIPQQLVLLFLRSIQVKCRLVTRVLSGNIHGAEWERQAWGKWRSVCSL